MTPGSYPQTVGGSDEYSAAMVGTDGTLTDDLIHSGKPCVRPALWIDLNA